MLLFELTARIEGFNNERVREWQHTRLIIAAHTGKDPRHIIPLPGDFEELQDLPKPEKVEQMFRSKKIWQT